MRTVRSHNHGNAILDDTRFLSGDVGNGVSQDSLVVESNRRNDAQLGSDDVGRVQSASQTHFHHSHIYLLFFEIIEGHSGYTLEKSERGREGRLDLVDAVQILHNVILRNHLSIDSDSLAEARYVRRHIHACLVPGCLQRLRNLVDNRSLAVRSRNVDGGDLSSGIAQFLVEDDHVLQSHLHFEVQVLRIQNLQQFYSNTPMPSLPIYLELISTL